MPTLLFLAANPINSEGIRLGEEYREIEDRLSSVQDNRIKIVGKWAVRPQDLQRALLEFSPALVHFSGHGDQDGQILLENPVGYPEPVTAEALSDLFRTFSSSVRCVFLNACESAEQARQLVQFIDCAIGMDGPVTVGAGKAFATSFYQALAYGKDVSTAFELGRNQIRLENLDEEEIPKLYFREGVDEVSLDEPSALAAQPPSVIEALIRAQLRSLTTAAFGVSEKFVLAPMPGEDEPPPIVEKCSNRATTVSRIQNELKGRHWYAIYGGIGSGKTHLGVLLARQHAGRCVWLRLRDQTHAQSLSVIHGALTQIKERQAGQTKAVWYEECFTALGKEAVLVLDDLPRTSGREGIDDTLVFLARAARKTHTKLITTSPFALTASTRAAVADDLMEELAPPFSEAEILELLAAHGAPAPFLTDAWAGTVSVICRQHPLLLTEAACFLEAKGWVISAQTFQEVISGQYAINLDAPTQDDLLRTIPDTDTRELLYRLRIVGRSFSGSDVRGLASIPKPVDHSAERLMSLLGLWIQRDGHDRYLVSPLVSRFSDSNLSRETERQVHEYLASSLLSQRPITALTAVQAIHHYVAADLYQKAGSLLWSSLLAYTKAKKPKDEFILSELWSHTSLPTQMSTPLRVGIRTAQISVFQEKGKDPSFLLADLERLLASEELSPDLEGFDVLLGGIAGAALWSRRPADAIRYVVRSLHSLRMAPDRIIPRVRSKRLRVIYYSLLWSCLSQVKTDSDLRLSLEQLGELPAPALSRWAEARLADLGAEVVCNEIWLREHRKPETERDWGRALGVLGSVGDWALERRITVLYAWAQRGRVIIIAEYLKRLNDAIALGEQATAACASSPKALFWLADIMGRQYYYVDRWREALSFLTRCVESPAEVKLDTRASVTALAGVSAANLHADSAVVLLSEAAGLATRHPKEVPAVLAASIHAELAFERWQRGEQALAFACLSQAADLLLNVREADDSWKSAITLIGNFAGFYVYIARGKSEDSWSYAKPAPGCVLNGNSSVVELFDPAKLYAIAGQLTMLAESLGLHEEALRWAGRANLADFDLRMHSLMVPYRVAAHVVEGRFAMALDESWGAYAAESPAPSGDPGTIPVTTHMGKIAAVIICFSLSEVRLRRGVAESEGVCVLLEEQLRRLAPAQLGAFWAAVVDALRQIASGGSNSRTLYETGLEWEKSDETQLGIIYRIAAMMNAGPSEAFHLTMCSFQRQLIPWLDGTPYHAVIIPFLRSYWWWAFEQYSVHFFAPSRTRKELEDALLAPGEPGLKNALKVVAGNLRITLTQRYKEYLG